MDYSNENETNIAEKKPNTILLVFLVAALVLVIVATVLIMVMNRDVNQIDQTTETTNENDNISAEYRERSAQINDLFRSGDLEAAEQQARELLQSDSISNNERGRVSLTLALILQVQDPVEATAFLKDISLEETFHPITRSLAIWHTVERYFGNRDTTFAAEHIFTGPVWEDYARNQYDDNLDLKYRLAAIEALRAALNLEITAQASMRLASEQAALLRFDELSDESKTEIVGQVDQYIAVGDTELVGLNDLDYQDYTGQKYIGTEYLVIATALNSKALALDTLYSAGYKDDPTVVINAYQDALESVIDYNIPTVHRYFIRYNYADFLARNSLTDNQQQIIAILTPFNQINSSNDASMLSYLVSNLKDTSSSKNDSFVGHPSTTRELASVSTEFRTALLNNGVNEQDLERVN